MKSALVLVAGVAGYFASLVSASPAFKIFSLTAYEPNGDPDGQVDFYHLNFTVSSCNGASEPTAICTKTWSDNAWTQPQSYSVNVPSGDWMACSDPAFSFQLFPYFSIGNFTLGVQQNMSESVKTDQTLLSGTAHLTNTSASDPALTCSINPYSESPTIHSSGSCSLPSSATLAIPASTTSTVPACPASSTVNTTFVVTAQTSPGQTILLSGSVPELGDWDTSKVIVLSSNDNDGSVAAATWSASVALPGGDDVQYKYLLDDGSGGALEWECCENREYTVPAQGYCKEVVAGNDPDTFRG